MIYVCGSCGFVFERTGGICSCPGCGKPGIREASEDERDEYRKTRAAIGAVGAADAKNRKDRENRGVPAKNPL
jgi:uncharacterized Zn finger protein (UPF0148 family)